jgi:hypothetical protein
MNTLIYKRTHTGDPDKSGIFGIHDCMGRVRCWNFDAVIGVGGKSPLHGHEGIAFKITWIGINPRKIEGDSEVVLRGPLLGFEYFVLWDENGKDLKKLAPHLFRYIFEDQQVRVVMSRSLPSREMQEEVTNILKLAKNHKSTTSRVFGKNISTKHKC